jgi:hypothetical protein
MLRILDVGHRRPAVPTAATAKGLKVAIPATPDEFGSVCRELAPVTDKLLAAKRQVLMRRAPRLAHALTLVQVENAKNCIICSWTSPSRSWAGTPSR